MAGEDGERIEHEGLPGLSHDELKEIDEVFQGVMEVSRVDDAKLEARAKNIEKIAKKLNPKRWFSKFTPIKPVNPAKKDKAAPVPAAKAPVSTPAEKAKPAPAVIKEKDPIKRSRNRQRWVGAGMGFTAAVGMGTVIDIAVGDPMIGAPATHRTPADMRSEAEDAVLTVMRSDGQIDPAEQFYVQFRAKPQQIPAYEGGHGLRAWRQDTGEITEPVTPFEDCLAGTGYGNDPTFFQMSHTPGYTGVGLTVLSNETSDAPLQFTFEESEVSLTGFRLVAQGDITRGVLGYNQCPGYDNPLPNGTDG